MLLVWVRGDTDEVSLLVKCRGWEPEIRRMWQRVRIDCEWGGAPSVRFLFGNERAIPSILEFLEKTKAGKMPGRILLAEGPDLEEEDLDTIFLQAGEGEVSDVSSSE